MAEAEAEAATVALLDEVVVDLDPAGVGGLEIQPGGGVLRFQSEDGGKEPRPLPSSPLRLAFVAELEDEEQQAPIQKPEVVGSAVNPEVVDLFPAAGGVALVMAALDLVGDLVGAPPPVEVRAGH